VRNNQYASGARCGCGGGLHYCDGGVCQIGGQGMSGYFYTLLVASVCGAVCMMLVWGGFEKYIKYIASLICVVLLISPLREIDIIAFTEDAFENSDVENGAHGSDLYAISERITEQSAEKYICDIVYVCHMLCLYFNVKILKYYCEYCD
jgi:hypothetical protein